MNKLRLLGGVLLFALIATGFAYIIGTGFLSFRYGLNGQYLDWTLIARDYLAMRNNDPQAFQILNLIWGGFIILSLLFQATTGVAESINRMQDKARTLGKR